MSTQQIQIKLTVTPQLKEFLATKATRLGLPISSYIRHLIIRDVEGVQYPVYKMSKRLEKIARQAEKDYKAGKAIEMKDIDKFFEDL